MVHGVRPQEVAVTHNPESLPERSDPSGPCPRCGFIAAFDHPGNAFTPLNFDGSERVIVLKCMGCRDSVAVVERRLQSPNGQVAGYEGIHWWPLPGLGDLDPDIPPPGSFGILRGDAHTLGQGSEGSRRDVPWHARAGCRGQG